MEIIRFCIGRERDVRCSSFVNDVNIVLNVPKSIPISAKIAIRVIPFIFLQDNYIVYNYFLQVDFISN